MQGIAFGGLLSGSRIRVQSLAFRVCSILNLVGYSQQVLLNLVAGVIVLLIVTAAVTVLYVYIHLGVSENRGP